MIGIFAEKSGNFLVLRPGSGSLSFSKIQVKFFCVLTARVVVSDFTPTRARIGIVICMGGQNTIFAACPANPPPGTQKQPPAIARSCSYGAGNGSRTHLSTLGRSHSTDELYPHVPRRRRFVTVIIAEVPVKFNTFLPPCEIFPVLPGTGRSFSGIMYCTAAGILL